MIAQYRMYEPFIGPCDPCPPIPVKVFNTPPHLYLGFQPMLLPQFDLSEALKRGTLWPCLYSPYVPRH
jgi:spore coat protein JA